MWLFSCLFGGPFCFVDSIFASWLGVPVSHGGDVVVVLWLRGVGDSVVVVVMVIRLCGLFFAVVFVLRW